MPYILTVWIAKIVGHLSRVLGRGEGATVPGYVAERLRPKILGELGAQLRRQSILITGTNGKTTTTKLVREMFMSDKRALINNHDGSNLARGVLTALIGSADLMGRLPTDSFGLFEVDEAAVPEVAEAIKPGAIAVLNLFRDQLDRYGELDSTAELIGAAIKRSQADALLNADDPLVASLAGYVVKPAKVTLFGLEAPFDSGLKHDHSADSTHDPVTGETLKYSQIYFGHLGHYRSVSGKFQRPKPGISISRIRSLTVAGTDAVLSIGGTKLRLKSTLPGLYNLYNALGAMTAADYLGLDTNQCLVSLAQTTPAFGRVETINVDGKELQLLLIKNPTGFNQVIQTFLLAGQNPVLFAINDNFADGRDVSWLWDAAIEDLPSGVKYSASGIRAADMAVRLKYADISCQNIEPDTAAALRSLLHGMKPGSKAFVVPTYTAMLEIRQLLGAGRSMVRS